MVTQHPLDTPGVQASVAAIYAKPTAEQAIIRNAIRTDLRAWLQTSMLLDSAQSAYLDNMSEEALHAARNLVADALENNADFLYMESTPPPTTMARNRDPKGKEILMGMKKVQRVAPVPTEDEDDMFLILVNYYGDESA